MTGGLIQIVTYGSQDLFLTGTPEITFFKIVYRRHTNFATESVEVAFTEEVGFGKESMISVPRVGDLIKNVYLKLTIPKMELKRNLGVVDDTDYNNALSNYSIVRKFMSVNIEAYRRGYDVYIADNVITVEDIVNAIIGYMSDAIYTVTISNFETLIGSSYNKDAINLLTIAQSYLSSLTDPKINIFKNMTTALTLSSKVQEYYYNLYVEKREEYNTNSSDLLKFAWVEKLGHSIIEYVDVFIGGRKIDRQYGDWINIWYELTKNIYTDTIYDKLIGNTSELTTFDRTVKPSYTMYIPLQFWFCRNNGLALPLVALEYHDVNFTFKFRNLEEVSYLEQDKLIYFENISEELYLDELSVNEGVYLEASLLIDFIYMDSSERRKFAQSSHEYLIEQVQVREFTDINVQNLSCMLDFNHSCKELIWVAQRVDNVENSTGYNKCKWYDYTVNGSGNIVLTSQIDFNGYERVYKENSNYFNYLQPLYTHSSTPSDGVNVYSFSFNPEEHQPSGQCNMSRLSKPIIHVTFDPDIFTSASDSTRVLNFRIYIISYNILRFVSGMAGCAYTS